LTELRLLDREVLEIGDSVRPFSFLDRRVCVALTAYNDREAISHVVREFLSQKNVVEVVVVDNNSHDGTTQEALNAGAVVVHEGKQGYGFACIRGLREALRCVDADVVVLAEGDMTFRGRDIWKLLPFLDDADMVVGSRTHMCLVDSDSQMDWFYVWGNLFLAKVLQFRFLNFRFLGRARFTDVGCTMRAINRDALEKIISKLDVGAYHFSPHMTLVALKSGLKILEVPITFRRRSGVSKGAGGSKRLGIKIGLRMLWHILTS